MASGNLVTRAALLLLALAPASPEPLLDLASFEACLADVVGCTSLNTRGSGVTGTIPTELALLSELRELDLSFEGYTGVLPTEVGALAHLHTFYANNNALEGSIPTEFGRLTAMGDAVLRENSLSGPIPSQLGAWSALSVM